MFANTYPGLRVFVTGHTGFKGSWLCAWLLSQGAEVAGFADGIPTEPSCFEALELHKKITDLRGDIRSAAEIQNAIDSFKPQLIIHLAAQALVRESYAHPVETFQTNIMGTLNVLEASRHCDSIKAVVLITSDKCYRNDEWVYGYREIDRLGGADPYSASKACAELICHSYFDSYLSKGPACATARAGNVIGGGDWAADRIVPDCAKAWHKELPVTLRNPDATRPWQHVLEPLSGYLWLAANLLKYDSGPFRNQSYNFGPADAVHTVAEVTRGLARHWPGFNFTVEKNPHQPRECGLLKLCCDKALSHLQWRATLDFEETIRYTADWYARYYAEASCQDMWGFTQGQIAAYTVAAQNRSLAWTKS